MYGQCALECCISLVDLELGFQELARMKILVAFKLFTSYLFAHFLATRPSAFTNVPGKSTICNWNVTVTVNRYHSFVFYRIFRLFEKLEDPFSNFRNFRKAVFQFRISLAVLSKKYLDAYIFGGNRMIKAQHWHTKLNL